MLSHRVSGAFWFVNERQSLETDTLKLSNGKLGERETESNEGMQQGTVNVGR